MGGYITFAGAHRLIDAGQGGRENLSSVNIGALSAIGLASLMHLLLFTVALGVISAGYVLISDSPAASVFQLAIGDWSDTVFGLVIWSAGISSVVGPAYTSVSFIKTFQPILQSFIHYIIIVFISISCLIFESVGKPVKTLITVGTINGFTLPLALG